MDPLDLEPTIVHVEIGGTKFELREATADAACKYRNACARTARLADGKVVGVDGLGDVEPLLVSLCLWGSGKQVPLATVRGWPARVVSKLFERAKQISGLAEDNNPKKPPSSTGTTSDSPANSESHSTNSSAGVDH